MAPGSCCERRRGERSAGTSAGPGRSMKPWAEGMSPLSEPGPPPDSPPSPEDAHIFPSPFAFFFFFFPPFPGFAAKRRTGLAGMLGREAPLSQAPRAGGRGPHPPAWGAHTSPAPGGEARPCPHHHPPLHPGLRLCEGRLPPVSTRDPQAPPALGTGQVAAEEQRYLRYFRYSRPSKPMGMSRGEEGTLGIG